mmetsp:Transcript_35358/g.82767  ORF Transcript_35358/g.82767 Transcript_35358/m.82767 type:complete len:267 (+) Transcript_35358:467-1267(+)
MLHTSLTASRGLLPASGRGEKKAASPAPLGRLPSMSCIEYDRGLGASSVCCFSISPAPRRLPDGVRTPDPDPKLPTEGVRAPPGLSGVMGGTARLRSMSEVPGDTTDREGVEAWFCRMMAMAEGTASSPSESKSGTMERMLDTSRALPEPFLRCCCCCFSCCCRSSSSCCCRNACCLKASCLTASSLCCCCCTASASASCFCLANSCCCRSSAAFRRSSSAFSWASFAFFSSSSFALSIAFATAEPCRPTTGALPPGTSCWSRSPM